MTGRLLGTVQVPSTGGLYSYSTARASVAGFTGHHDVYLVPTGDLRISRFSIR